jgi:hypothetical protein
MNEANIAQLLLLATLVVQAYVSNRDRKRADVDKAAAAERVASEARENETKKATLAATVVEEAKQAAASVAVETREVAKKTEEVRQTLADTAGVAEKKLSEIGGNVNGKMTALHDEVKGLREANELMRVEISAWKAGQKKPRPKPRRGPTRAEIAAWTAAHRKAR